ncbi:MFS general substrate transporter [Parathielavia appendiculata]|uniref:MFS general substrate transporter n=1 Tax=Parathielavia appendiculata TaxID=2587402 RepID=A0AAN6Z6K2_9PEZI|nr:MFS general substrate transporter [Parathielavia appendiculata]
MESGEQSREQSTRPPSIHIGVLLQIEESQPSTKPSVAELSHRRPSNASKDEAVAPKDEPQWMTGRQLHILSACFTISMFLIMLDTSVIATAIPRITDEFHSLQDIGWYVSIYQLASAVLQPLVGRIYHKFNNKVSFLAFFTIFEIGSIVCGAAVSSGMFIAGRAVAGVGSAGIVSGVLTIAAAAMPLQQRVLIMGIMLGCGQLGVAVGPLIGGAMTSFATWRWCFYLNVPVGGLLVAGLLLSKVPDQCQKPSPWSTLRNLYIELDMFGFFLLSLSTVLLLLALSWGGNKYAWNSASIIWILDGAFIVALFWLAWDWFLGDEALVPFSVIKRRPVWSGALTHCFLMTNVFCASFYLPIYFQAVQGASPMMSGVDVLASILSQLAAVPVASVLASRTGYVVPFAMLSAIIGAVSNGMYSTLSPTTATGQWVGYQIFNGVGRGMGMQMAIMAVQASVKPADVATTNSFVIFVQSLGTAIMLAASDAIFEGSLKSGLSKQAPLADAAAIIAAGATHFRALVSEDELPGVLVAYALAIDHVFYLVAGVSSLGVATSLCLGWVNLRKKQTPGNDDIPMQNLGTQQVLDIRSR